MKDYDQWKLATPDWTPAEQVADFYEVDPDDVTDDMLANYEQDRREYDDTRWED